MIRKIGVVAVAIAIGGLAIAPAAPAASATQQVKKLKKKVSSLESRLAALEARPTGGSPTGTAGGELSGSYPNPTIGTVAGLQLAASDFTNPGIVLGPGGAEIAEVFGVGSLGVDAPGGFHVFGTASLTDDVTLLNANSAGNALRLGSPDPANLYRSAADTLHTDDSLSVADNLTVGLGTSLNGTISLPNATSAANGLVFGSTGTAELHQNGIDTLRTNDNFQVGGNLSVTGSVTGIGQLAFPNTTAPTAPASGGILFVDCVAGTNTLKIIWAGGAVDPVTGASQFNSCT